jgi:C4-dicarboxylate transporter DctM subunit
MSLMMTGFIGFAILFFLLLVVNVPVGFGMILVGFAGMAYVTSLHSALSFLGHQVFSVAASYDMAMVAMFIFMGELAFNTGIGTKSFESIQKILGKLRGSLAMASIGACAAFAAVCGSSPATAATIGSIALPEMKKCGYDDSLATGCIAAGGTLGILIPPSLGFILFGLLTEQSIAKLYLAGIMPGILLAVLFMLTSFVFALYKKPGFSTKSTSLYEKVVALKGLVEIVILFVVVVGGMGIGLFTPTAAGAIGSFGALIISLIKRNFTWEKLLHSLSRTIATVGMIIVLFVGAMIFNYFLAASTLPFQLSGLIAKLSVPPIVTVVVILIMWLVLGCVMDAIGMIVLTLPIIYPIVVSLGFDVIWFSVLGVIMIEAGLITPPVGMNAYIIRGIAGEVPIGRIFIGILPYLIALFICVGLLLAFPQIALFLPERLW